MSHVFTIAMKEWEWVKENPVRMVSRERKDRSKERWLTLEEEGRLLKESPPWLKDILTFAIHTGFRQSEILDMQWSQVDLVRQLAWIHPDQAKARKAIPVPLNADAVAIVTKQVGKHHAHVFSFRGKPIVQVSTKAWYAALERAGIEDFRWHDLRHTWASWHVQNGTPLFALQELGGWSSTEMVRRYAHLAANHLAPYAERLSAVRAEAMSHGTNPSQG